MTSAFPPVGTFIHQVTMRFADHATTQQRQATLDALAAFREHALTLPGIHGFMLGTDLGLRAPNYDFGLVVSMESVETWRMYTDDAVHQDFLNNHVTPTVAERVAVQYEVK